MKTKRSPHTNQESVQKEAARILMLHCAVSKLEISFIVYHFDFSMYEKAKNENRVKKFINN